MAAANSGAVGSPSSTAGQVSYLTTTGKLQGGDLLSYVLDQAGITPGFNQLEDISGSGNVAINPATGLPQDTQLLSQLGISPAQWTSGVSKLYTLYQSGGSYNDTSVGAYTGNPVSTAEGAIAAPFSDVASFFKWLGSGGFQQIGEVILGVVLLGIGANAALKGSLSGGAQAAGSQVTKFAIGPAKKVGDIYSRLT